MVVLADGENANLILELLDAGAKGFIPTSVSLEVAIEAMRLVRAGGTFVPASSLLASRSMVEQPAPRMKARADNIFTERQSAVVEMLRQGKANKIIAYELNMRESTVKVPYSQYHAKVACDRIAPSRLPVSVNDAERPISSEYNCLSRLTPITKD